MLNSNVEFKEDTFYSVNDEDMKNFKTKGEIRSQIKVVV